MCVFLKKIIANMETKPQLQQMSQTYIYNGDCLESLLITKQKYSKTQIIYNPFLAKLSLALDPIKLDEELSFELEEETTDSFDNDYNNQHNVCKRNYLKESSSILSKMSDFVLN